MIVAMSKLLLTLLVGNAGVIVRWIAGLIVACLVALFAHMGFDLDADTTTKLAVAVMACVAGALGEISARVNVNGITQIQDALKKVSTDIRSDGHAGDVTVAVAKQIAAQVDQILKARKG